MPDGIAPVPEENAMTLYTPNKAWLLNDEGVTALHEFGKVTIEILPLPGRTTCDGKPITRVWPPKPKDEE